MKPQISITIEPDKVGIKSPFNPRNNDRFRATGGKFDGGQWNFANTPATSTMIDDLFGSSEDYVQIRVDADDGRVEACNNTLVLGGYVLADRRSRDARVNIADGVQLYSGQFRSSGGSMKSPRVSWEGTVLLDILVRRDFAARWGFPPVEEPTDSTAAPDAQHVWVIAAVTHTEGADTDAQYLVVHIDDSMRQDVEAARSCIASFVQSRGHSKPWMSLRDRTTEAILLSDLPDFMSEFSNLEYPNAVQLPDDFDPSSIPVESRIELEQVWIEVGDEWVQCGCTTYEGKAECLGLISCEFPPPAPSA